jgi:D-amino-acid dehydrogenase
MRMASTIQFSDDDTAQLRPATVAYVDSHRRKDDPTLLAFLISEGVDLLITDRMPPSHIVRAWKQARNATVIIIVAETLGNVECITGYSDDAVVVFFSRDVTPIGKAVAAAETAYTREITSRRTRAILDAATRKGREKVLVVGAGIIGLMTAMHLADNGYDVEVYEASGDPRSDADWRTFGCTHGGENARMFSLTECDNYHDRELVAGAHLHGQLAKPITDMGWLIGHANRFSANEEEWIKDFTALPIFLAEKYNEDIFALNHESLKYWKGLLNTHPFLFEDVELRDGLLRIASTGSYHDKQMKRQKSVRSFLRELDQASVISDYPALEKGCRNGEISGGIEVVGFTVNVHNFVNNVIEYLESNRVVFHWNAAAERVVTRDNSVGGIVVNGELRKSDHYFLSPGVYGGNILNESESRNKVHGVLGAWISFPNLSPKLQRSLKISREGHIANSGNIIPAKNARGEDILIFGSGFGYVGTDPRNIDNAQLDALYQSMEDYTAALFPEAYRQALESGELRESRRYCIRPWTASSLGVFEIKLSDSGLLIIASGHNTGGFSQSTSVAKATVDAMQGRFHPMHLLYHPKRFDDFWARRPPLQTCGQTTGYPPEMSSPTRGPERPATASGTLPVTSTVAV